MKNKLAISIFLTIFSLSILADLSKPTTYSKDLYPTPILTGKYNESIDHPINFLILVMLKGLQILLKFQPPY